MDLRTRVSAWLRRQICFFGFHGKPIGLVEWSKPYVPGDEVLRMKNYLGCPHCRQEARL